MIKLINILNEIKIQGNKATPEILTQFMDQFIAPIHAMDISDLEDWIELDKKLGIYIVGGDINNNLIEFKKLTPLECQKYYDFLKQLYHKNNK